jgi:hypothetical protein
MPHGAIAATEESLSDGPVATKDGAARTAGGASGQ